MISLEGLTLATGRHREAGYILRTFAHYVRDGLIPNMFPEGADEGCITPPTRRCGSSTRSTLPPRHRRPRDAAACCCRSSSTSSSTTCAARASASASTRGRPAARRAREGYQLTWMDAKVDDWVVTPRRGKAVEINALWYNALRLLERWVRRAATAMAGDRADRTRASAAQASFNARFWYDDARLSLRRRRRRATATIPPAGRTRCSRSRCDHPVLDRERWAAGDGRGARATAHAGRPALARARAPGLQGALLRRPALRATPPITRAPSGPG